MDSDGDPPIKGVRELVVWLVVFVAVASVIVPIVGDWGQGRQSKRDHDTSSRLGAWIDSWVEW